MFRVGGPAECRPLKSVDGTWLRKFAVAQALRGA
jgi:hypothetical protein